MAVDQSMIECFADSLAYVGHSLGTDIMFALQSMVPNIGQVVRPYIALAPVAYIGDIWSSARLGVPLEPLLRYRSRLDACSFHQD